MHTIPTTPSRRAFWAVLLALPLLLTACDLSGLENINEDNYGLLIALDEIDTPVLATVYDAATGERVRGEVKLTVTGEDAGVVIDAYSDPVDAFTVKKGRLSFGIQNGVTPSQTDPVRFTVSARADGYVATSQNVKLTESGSYAVDLYLIRPSRPPQGTAVQQDQSGQAGSDGATSAPVSVTTAPEAQTQATATASVPQGTTFKTADGTRLTGQLTTTLTYYNNISEESLQSLPGASNAQAQVDGGTAQAILRPAGAIAFGVSDAQGQAAATADKQVEAFIEINQETVNPQTGQPYAEGDEISLWSFDEESGAWQRVKRTTLTRRAGKAGQGFGILGISLNWDFGPPIVAGAIIVENGDDAGQATTCTPTFTFERNGNTGLLPIRISGSVAAAKTLRDGVSSWNPGQEFLSTDVITVKVYRPEGRQDFVNVSPCNTASFDLIAASSQVITMNATATITCEDPNKKIIISDGDFSMTYQPKNGAAGEHLPILIPKDLVQKQHTNDRLSGLSISLAGLVDGVEYELNGTVLDYTITHDETAAPSKSFNFTVDEDDVCQ